MFKKNKDKKLEREYFSIINLISHKIEKDKYMKEDIIGKELIVVYDDILPDLFVEIEINKKIIKRYELNKIGKDIQTERVFYDVYTDRILEVVLKFPNGKSQLYKVDYACEERDDELYSCSWQVPIIKYNFNGVILELSLLELMKKGVKVYITKYKPIKGEE